MARLLGVSTRRLAAWEQGIEEPAPAAVARIRDVMRDLPDSLLESLSLSIVGCGLPRALSRSPRLTLQAVSGPAITKRPSIVEWIGKDLEPIATGVLREILDDRELQQSIARREVLTVVATTRSVLRTGEEETVGTYRTTINYFFHDGVVFSDAVAVPAPAEERIGYTPIHPDEIGSDLFGDRDALEQALEAGEVDLRWRRAG